MTFFNKSILIRKSGQPGTDKKQAILQKRGSASAETLLFAEK